MNYIGIIAPIILIIIADMWKSPILKVALFEKGWTNDPNFC